MHIADSVTSIGDYAFSGCSSLAAVHVPDSVIWIGESAFAPDAPCWPLLNILDAMTSIGEDVLGAWVLMMNIEAPLEHGSGGNIEYAGLLYVP